MVRNFLLILHIDVSFVLQKKLSAIILNSRSINTDFNGKNKFSPVDGLDHGIHRDHPAARY